MGLSEERMVKTTRSLLIDDLKVYQENHIKPEIVNKIIVKISSDIRTCYREMC